MRSGSLLSRGTFIHAGEDLWSLWWLSKQLNAGRDAEVLSSAKRRPVIFLFPLLPSASSFSPVIRFSSRLATRFRLVSLRERSPSLSRACYYARILPALNITSDLKSCLQLCDIFLRDINRKKWECYTQCWLNQQIQKKYVLMIRQYKYFLIKSVGVERSVVIEDS